MRQWQPRSSYELLQENRELTLVAQDLAEEVASSRLEGGSPASAVLAPVPSGSARRRRLGLLAASASLGVAVLVACGLATTGRLGSSLRRGGGAGSAPAAPATAEASASERYISLSDADGRGGQGHAVLHFMFMAIDDVFHVDIWTAFFADAPKGSYRIWLHCKNQTACLEGDFMKKLPETEVVPTVPASYCTDLVTPEIQLLGHALANSSGSTHGGEKVMEKFALVSDSSLPLKPFSYVLDELTRNPQSDLCVYPLCPRKECRLHRPPFNYWAHGVQTKNNEIASLPMASQFFVLNRGDAEKFTNAWGAPNSRPIGTMHEQYFGETKAVDTTTKRPVWNMSIIGGVSDGERYPLTDFSGWRSCIDEEATFSMIYGAVIFGKNKSLDLPGFGKLSNEEKYFDRPQGTCRSFFSFYLWNLDDGKLEASLGNDTDSIIVFPRVTDASHPLAFKKLSRPAMQLLRETPYLFGRKFEPDGDFSGYAETVFK